MSKEFKKGVTIGETEPQESMTRMRRKQKPYSGRMRKILFRG